MEETSPGSGSSSTHVVRVPRKVKSEPPQSPRQDLRADVIMEPNVAIPGPDRLPAHGAVTQRVPVLDEACANCFVVGYFRGWQKLFFQKEKESV